MPKTAFKPIIQIVILACLAVALFFLFEWQTAAAMSALAVLIIAQVYYLASRVKIRSSSNTQKQMHPQAQRPTPTVQPSQESTFEATSEKTKIDSSVFSTFQKNLDASQKDQAIPIKKKQPKKPALEPNEVVLSLSNKAKKAPTKPKPSTPKTEPPKPGLNKANPYIKSNNKKPEVTKQPTKADPFPDTPIGSMFEDLHETLGSSEEPKKEEAKVIQPKKEQKKSVIKPEKKKVVSEKPLESKEYLSTEDLVPNEIEAQKEEEIIKTLAQNAYREGKFIESYNLIAQWLKSTGQKEGGSAISDEILELKANCEFETEKYEDSSKTWQTLVERKIKNKSDDYLSLVEDLIKKFTQKQQQQSALQFYFTALREYQRDNNYSKMDQVYTTIEQAYEQTKDLNRLIQTYQNHLSIKKSLKDFDGQLTLLDHLGKLLYDQGDSNGSKRCYQQSIEIKKEQSLNAD